MQQLGWDSILSFKAHLLQANPVGFYTKLFMIVFQMCCEGQLQGILEYLDKGGEAEENLLLPEMFFKFFLCIQTSLYLK